MIYYHSSITQPRDTRICSSFCNSDRQLDPKQFSGSDYIPYGVGEVGDGVGLCIYDGNYPTVHKKPHHANDTLSCGKYHCAKITQGSAHKCAALPRRKRLNEFGLSVRAVKTRVLEFGCRVQERQRTRGQGKPERFDLLGLSLMLRSKPNRTLHLDKQP